MPLTYPNPRLLPTTRSGTSRIWKSYKMPLALGGATITGSEMSFSSYPGYLSSLDDTYMIWSSGMAVIETTNSIFNTSLYSLVKPQSLFAWQRVRISNMLAASGLEWGALFGEHNSGVRARLPAAAAATTWPPDHAPTRALPRRLTTTSTPSSRCLAGLQVRRWCQAR